MRRNFYWGLLLIVIGLGYFIEQTTYIDVPIVTLAIAFTMIYWGLSIIISTSRPQKHIDREQEVIFTQQEIKGTPMKDKYDVIFGDSTVDLTTLPMPSGNKPLKIDCIFSRVLVRINPDIPMIIKMSSVFGSAHAPNGSSVSFGDYTYTTRSFVNGAPCYYVKLDVVFGHGDVIELKM